jgi:hypothetical protein
VILALRILSFTVLLIASPARDPGDLVGTWTVDLRPTPDSGRYYQPFTIQEADFQTLSGTFYGSSPNAEPPKRKTPLPVTETAFIEGANGRTRTAHLLITSERR